MCSEIVLLDGHPRVDDAAVRAAVRRAFEQLANGRAVQPPQTVTDLPDGGDAITYQGVLGDDGVLAVKVSPYLPQGEGPAVVTAWTLLLSTRTGQPLLLADAAALTVERTAATTALAVELLASRDARRLAVIGLGPVGRAHLRHARAVRPFDEVRVWSPTSTAETVADLGVHLAGSADEAAAGADVVLLCTSAAAPVIDVRRLDPGTLVASVSTNAPLAHEIDPSALGDLDIYADLAPAAFPAAGEMRIAARDHGFTAEGIRGDLAGLLSGRSPSPSGDRVVFFRSVGLGIEDAAVALTALHHLKDPS